MNQTAFSPAGRQLSFLRTGFMLSLCLTFFEAQPVSAQTPRFVEFTTEEGVFAGKIVAKGNESLWLMQRDGRLLRLKTTDITSFRKLADEFTPYSAVEMRDLLRREFRDLEVIGTGTYLVVGPTKCVRDHAQIFEDQYRALRHHFSVRGFDLPEPEFPLVAIVHPTAAKFVKQAQADGFRVSPGLRGYYTPGSNRISLYHQSSAGTSRSMSPTPHENQMLFAETPARSRIAAAPSEWDWDIPSTHPDSDIGLIRRQGPSWRFANSEFPVGSPLWASPEGDLEVTMIHEATHQVAFNIGIHRRLSNANPRWLVEGLATAFEAPGLRSASLQKVAGARVNLSRLHQFQDFVKLRRRPKSLADFIGDGNLTGLEVWDGYAQSWALTYFLIETRPREYAQYLKLIANRPLLTECTSEDRLRDFRTAFGGDLTLLEAKFLRYMEQLRHLN